MHESEKWKVKVKSLSRVQLFATPWTAVHQAPPSIGFSRQSVLEWGAIAFSLLPMLSRNPGLLNYYVSLTTHIQSQELLSILQNTFLVHIDLSIKIQIQSEGVQSCPTFCDPMDRSLPGSSVHGIFQAKVLEWIAISFSRGSSRLRDRTQVSCIAGRRFTLWATREALSHD